MSSIQQYPVPRGRSWAIFCHHLWDLTTVNRRGAIVGHISGSWCFYGRDFFQEITSEDGMCLMVDRTFWKGNNRFPHDSSWYNLCHKFTKPHYNFPPLPPISHLPTHIQHGNSIKKLRSSIYSHHEGIGFVHKHNRPWAYCSNETKILSTSPLALRRISALPIVSLTSFTQFGSNLRSRQRSRLALAGEIKFQHDIEVLRWGNLAWIHSRNFCRYRGFVVCLEVCLKVELGCWSPHSTFFCIFSCPSSKFSEPIRYLPLRNSSLSFSSFSITTIKGYISLKVFQSYWH